MHRLRHAFAVRLVALLVSVGVLGALVPSARATPARTASWLRARAVDADAEALGAALAVVLSRGNLPPSAFLDAYAEAQPRFGAPSGAWFGMADLSFRAALERLRDAASDDLAAPPKRVPVYVSAPLAVSAPVVPGDASAVVALVRPLPGAAADADAPVPTPTRAQALAPAAGPPSTRAP